MLKHNEVNPLAVFGLRQVEYLPPHFTTITFDIGTTEKIITDWIWENLSGRFYIGDTYTQGQENRSPISLQKLVGFEIPGEASYFSLILDTINKNEYINW